MLQKDCQHRPQRSCTIAPKKKVPLTSVMAGTNPQFPSPVPQVAGLQMEIFWRVKCAVILQTALFLFPFGVCAGTGELFFSRSLLPCLGDKDFSKYFDTEWLKQFYENIYTIRAGVKLLIPTASSYI